MSVLFVDESKANGYLMVATQVNVQDISHHRNSVRSLVLPGQRRIHFTKESDRRRKEVLSHLCDIGFEADVYHYDTKDQVLGREMCLSAIVSQAAIARSSRIVLERDESTEKFDRRILSREVKRHSIGESISYGFLSPSQEPLLWVSDAIAWSFTKGGEWKHRATPLVREFNRLS